MISSRDSASSSIRQELTLMLRGMPNEMAEVIRRRFGLDGRTQQSLKSVAAAMGLPQARVRSIERAALTLVGEEASFAATAHEEFDDGRMRPYREFLQERIVDSDWRRLEEAAAILFHAEIPDLVPIGGAHDAGRDSVSRERRLTVAVSLQKTWQQKIRDEVMKLKKRSEGGQNLIFCTTQLVSGRGRAQLEAEVGLQGINLEIRDLRWWVSRLSQDDNAARIARDWLRVGPLAPPALVGHSYFWSMLSRRPGFIDADLFGREDLVATVTESLRTASTVLLHGQPGFGKTRIALEVARRWPGKAMFVNSLVATGHSLFDAFARSLPSLVILDDANFSAQLTDAVCQLQHQPGLAPPKLLVTSWSNEASKVTAALSGSPSLLATEVGPLPRRPMALMLRSSGVGMTSDRLIESAIRTAEGRPLLGVLAGKALNAGATVEQLERDGPLSVWFQHAWSRSLLGQPQKKVLAALALRGPTFIGGGDEPTSDLRLFEEAIRLPWRTVREHLLSLVDAGLAGVEIEDCISVRPDSFAHFAIWRLCFEKPIQVPPRDLVLRLALRSWSRLCSVLGAVADTYEKEDARILVRSVLKTWEEEEKGIEDLADYLNAVREAALVEPDMALALTRKVVMEPEFRSSGEALGTDRVHRAAVQVAAQAKFRALGAAVDLLFDLAMREDLRPESGVQREFKSPAFHELCKLAEYMDPHGTWRDTVAIRETLTRHITRWWQTDPANRSDLALSVAGSLLKPLGSAMWSPPEDSNKLNLAAGFLPSSPWGRQADAVVALVGEVLGHVNTVALVNFSESLTTLSQTAQGMSGPFNSRPPDDLRKLARDAVCTLVGVLRRRFRAQPGFEVKVHELALDAGCPTLRLSTNAQELRLLYGWPRGAANWRTARENRIKAVEGLATRWAKLTDDRIVLRLSELDQSAGEFGFNRGEMVGRFIHRVGEARGLTAVGLASELLKNSALAGLAPVALQHVWQSNPAEIADYLKSAADRGLPGLAFAVAVAARIDSASSEQIEMLEDLAARAPSESQGELEGALLRLTGEAATRLVSAMLRNSSATIQRLAVAYSSPDAMAGKGGRHRVNRNDRKAFEKALLTAGAYPMAHAAPDLADTVRELVDTDPHLVRQWIIARVERLSATAKFDHTEAFSDLEAQAIADAKGLLDDLDFVTKLLIAMRVSRNSFERHQGVIKALALVTADLPTAIGSWLRNGFLDCQDAIDLLEEIPFGEDWSRAAKLIVIEADDMHAALPVVQAAYPKGWVGSPISLYAERLALFEAWLADEDSRVQQVARNAIEHFSKLVAQEQEVERGELASVEA